MEKKDNGFEEFQALCKENNAKFAEILKRRERERIERGYRLRYGKLDGEPDDEIKALDDEFMKKFEELKKKYNIC